MHWESYYVHPADIQGETVFIRDEELRHLSRVMRKQPGDKVWVVDGQGEALLLEIQSIGKTQAAGQILERRKGLGEPSAEIVLFQALLKGEKFDWLVEKATELGVHTIVPVLTEQSTGQVNENRVQRWQRLTLAAMKQCGRSVQPQIAGPLSFSQSLQWGSEWTGRFLAEAGENSRSLSAGDVQSDAFPKIGMWIGPEGGFSAGELSLALESGLISITLGRRRLRAETAGLAMLIQTLDRLGEL